MDKLGFRRSYLLGAYALCALSVIALAGCGGGGGGSTTNSVVSSGDVAPTISGTPPTSATAGQAYSFTPTASGPSGMTLSFSIQNMPSWARFSSSTGALTGTPASSDVGTFSNIVISVSDGTQSASLSAFNIQVASSGSTSPPTISGTPPTTVTAGQAYSFTPTASGPAGTTLSFSIKNMPAWAAFNASTGALTGTPSSSYVGTFSNIQISVSDGSQSASLSAFSIQVASASGSGTGSVALSWTVPTTNTNGTPLTDLAGFTINYGTSSSSMNQTVTVGSAGTTGYTVQGLASGTWYFTVTAYTSVGTQSAPSDVVSTTIS